MGCVQCQVLSPHSIIEIMTSVHVCYENCDCVMRHLIAASPISGDAQLEQCSNEENRHLRGHSLEPASGRAAAGPDQ